MVLGRCSNDLPPCSCSETMGELPRIGMMPAARLPRELLRTPFGRSSRRRECPHRAAPIGPADPEGECPYRRGLWATTAGRGGSSNGPRPPQGGGGGGKGQAPW